MKKMLIKGTKASRTNEKIAPKAAFMDSAQPYNVKPNQNKIPIYVNTHKEEGTLAN